MRIHSDILTRRDLLNAATEARVYMETFTEHGSRSRERAFNVLLRGESNRRPNCGTTGAADDYAATWDQWGVFLAFLFYIDPNMKTPYYDDRDDFNFRTNVRFTKIGGGWHEIWPADYHGDHTFRWQGVPSEQSCTKCSAVQRW